MKCQINGEKLVKRAKWLKYFMRRPNVGNWGMDQVKATMESGFGAVGCSWIELSGAFI
jgi:hypothetical protein